MNVKNWSFFSSKEGKIEIKEHILDTVSLCGAIGLLWYAYISIIGEHFPEFLQVKSAGINWWIILLWIFILWLGYEWPKKYLKKLVVPCHLAGIAIPIAYIVLNFEKVIDGFFQLVRIYLPFVNSYYKTSFLLETNGSRENSIIAFTALSMLLWWILWMQAYGFKKRIILAFFPTFALILELVVGLSPMGNGLLYLLFGATLLLIIGGTSVAKKAVVLTCVGTSVLLSSFLFGENIQKLAAVETKQEVLNWQNDLNLDTFNLLNLFQIDVHYDWEKLSNNSPQYTGKSVLEIETDEKLKSIVYLKGFYGTNYESGNWTYDDSFFKRACDEASKSQEEVAKALFQMPYERMAEYYDNNLDIQFEYPYKTMIHYKISYSDTIGNVAYIPYVTDYESFDETYKLKGDYLLKKSVWDDTIEVSGINTANSVLQWMQKNGSNEDWLNSLSDAYLQVPQNMEFVSEAALKTKERISDEILYDLAQSENDKRILFADAVWSYLASQMSYSLTLDNLPSGADPIEYALTESHEGYCMHFASAATMILRELGVPARYVSGYAVRPSAFEYNEETGGYKAEVADYMAHAWVEIYLDNIGWIPVEVTPGSSLDSLPSDKEIQRWENNSNSMREHFKDEERQVEVDGSEQSLDETEIATEEQKETEQEANTEKESEEKVSDDEQRDGTKEEQQWNEILQGLKLLGILGMFAVVLLAIYVAVKRWISCYEAVLEREVEKNLTRKAVKRINRRLYFMLRIFKRRNWFMRKWTDIEYKSALVESFTLVSEEEWNQYMEIVKKTHYSFESISTEEMEYCYECYKKVSVFNILLTSKWFNKH